MRFTSLTYKSLDLAGYKSLDLAAIVTQCVFSVLASPCTIFREAAFAAPSELWRGPEPAPFLHQARQRRKIFLGEIEAGCLGDVCYH